MSVTLKADSVEFNAPPPPAGAPSAASASARSRGHSGNPHRRTALDSRDAKKPVRFTATFTTMPAMRIGVRVRLGNDYLGVLTMARGKLMLSAPADIRHTVEGASAGQASAIKRLALTACSRLCVQWGAFLTVNWA